MAHALQRLIIGDDPQSWADAGFAVEGHDVVLGKTTIELVGASGTRGILGWSLDGVAREIDGLPTVIVPDHHRPAPQEHPNMAFAIDHVVLGTNDFDRTVPAFEAAGLDERKTLTFDSPEGERRQSFFWAGRVILELVGPATAAAETPDDTATFWGLALVSANLGIAADLLNDMLGEPKDAVQPGRKIATLRTKELNISIPIALMSPHVANLGNPESS